MRRFHLWFSLIGLLAILAGAMYQPNNPMLWLTSTDVFTQMLRIILVTVIIAQIVTLPPRHMALRIATGLTAVAAGLYGINAFLAPNSPIIDGFIFLQTAIGLGISALEYNPKEELAIDLRRTPATVPITIKDTSTYTS